MKNVRRILLIVGYLAIAAAIGMVIAEQTADFRINTILILVLAIAGPVIILTDAAISFARTPGLSKNNFLRRFVIWLYNLVWGGLIGYGVFDIIFKLIDGDDNFTYPIIMLVTGVVMFLIYTFIIAFKDPDTKKEMAIAVKDERNIANNHKASYYAYYTTLGAMLVFAAIIGLIPITSTAVIVGGIVGICMMSFVLAIVLYLRYDKDK